MNVVIVGPALVAGPSRDRRDNRDGLPASGGPTARRRTFIGEFAPDGSALVLSLRMAGIENISEDKRRLAFFLLR